MVAYLVNLKVLTSYALSAEQNDPHEVDFIDMVIFLLWPIASIARDLIVPVFLPVRE